MRSPETTGISRRGALRLGVGLGAAVGLSQLVGGQDAQPFYRAETNELKAAAERYMQTDPAPRPMPKHEQMAVETNPRLQRKLGSVANHATVIVHPGYFMWDVRDMYSTFRDVRSPAQALAAGGYEPSDSVIKEWVEYSNSSDITSLAKLARGSEGNYDAYLANLARVYEQARSDPNTPLIVYTEARHLFSGVQEQKRLASPDHVLNIATAPNDPEPVDRVRYQGQNGITEEAQRAGGVFKWLRDSGIDRIHLAGEYGVARGGGLWSACAGTVAEELIQGGFDVHGIDGAIFPTQPEGLDGNWKYGQTKLETATISGMYIDTVPISR